MSAYDRSTPAAMPIDLHTLASASFLSKEDRRAYLKAMEREAKRQKPAEPAKPKRW